MANTYSGDPNASAVDKVRFLIGDTDSTDWQLSDEEITAMVTDAGDDANVGAIACAEAIAAKYSRRANKTVGDLNISYSQQATAYASLAQRLRRAATYTSNAAAPYAGGISRNDKRNVVANPDRVRPAFRKGMNDNPTPALQQPDPRDT